MNYDEFKMEVLKGVRERLKDKPWFDGVCVDTIKESHSLGLSLEQAISDAELDTIYWDGSLNDLFGK